MTDLARALVVGIDFGTLSGRAVVVRVRDGAELGSAVHPYARGMADRHRVEAAGWIEAIAYGTRLVIETFRGTGVAVDELVLTGGLQKNPLVMQIYADVTRMPISLLDSDQGPALGSALHAAVAAGAYPDIRTAAASMGRVVRHAWRPRDADADRYDALYADYLTPVDYFGRHHDVMRRLRSIRREALR